VYSVPADGPQEVPKHVAVLINAIKYCCVRGEYIVYLNADVCFSYHRLSKTKPIFAFKGNGERIFNPMATKTRSYTPPPFAPEGERPSRGSLSSIKTTKILSNIQKLPQFTEIHSSQHHTRLYITQSSCLLT
jgi:hypothetical protein